MGEDMTGVQKNIALFGSMILLLLAGESCTKDSLGVTDGSGGRPVISGVIVRRSTTEAYYAMRYSGEQNLLSNATAEGGGVIGISFQDTYFEDVSGYPGQPVRPVIERNLLLAGITMSFRLPNKGGIQSFGATAEASYKGIVLKHPEGTADAGLFRRSFAYTRGADGSVSGAQGYDGATEPFDAVQMDFFHGAPLFSLTHSDTAEDVSRSLSVPTAFSFDSGKVFPSTGDLVLKLSRPVKKGSLVSFSKLRGANAMLPFVPSVVSFELLTDTSEIRIPHDEVSQIITILTTTTAVPKPFNALYPVWLTVIESGPCDTLTLMHRETEKEFPFTVFRYYEFSRKIYFK